MSGRPFRGGRRGGGYFPRAPYRGRGRGFRGGPFEGGRGRGRGRGGYGYNKRYDDDRDRDRDRDSRDRYSRDRYYSRSRSRSRSRTRSRSRSRSYSRSRSRSRSRSKTPQRETRTRKMPTKKELQEIAAAVTKSINKEKEQLLRPKTPVRTRSGYIDAPSLASTRRSLSPVARNDSPYESSRDYGVSRPKTPQHKPKDSGDSGFRAQLLELALKEKQKLGLDKLDSPRSSSSALKAIQSYSGTRSPEESDHEDQAPQDLYDDLPKPLFPIASKGGSESTRKAGGGKLVSSFTPVETRKKPIDDIFPDVDEYEPRRDAWEDRRDSKSGGGSLRMDRRPDSRPESHRPDSRTDLYADLLSESHGGSQAESRFHGENSRSQRQSSTLIPGLGIDDNIDDEDAFLYGDEAPSAARTPSVQEKKPFIEEPPRKKPLPQESWMPTSQRFCAAPASPDVSDLTIDLKLPFDRRKTAESVRAGKMYLESKQQRTPEPPPVQRGSRRMMDRIPDDPEPLETSWKSQRHRTPSPNPSPPPMASRAPKPSSSSKQSMLGFNSIESMKQELRELKMMLSREKEAKEDSYERERKRLRSPSEEGSYIRAARSPSPVKRRRESYSPSHRRRGRSPGDSYRRPSPPSYRRERRESPYYRGAATPSARRYSPSPANSLSPSSDRSMGKRWSPSPPPRHVSRRQEGRTPGRRWSPESPPPRPRRSSLERTPKHPSSQTPYYQGSAPPTQPGYYEQSAGPPLIPPPNLSVPPPNFPISAPPPQAAPYFAGYPPPAQAPPDYSYPPPASQQQQARSNLRVVPLHSGMDDSMVPVKQEASLCTSVKQEESNVVIAKKQQTVTQEEIDNYLRLVETKDSYREKINLLKQELVRLGKIQNEIMRRRQHDRDGHRDPLLLESSSMYEDVKKQVLEVNSNMEEVSRKIFKVSQKVKLEAIAYKKRQEEEALAAESPDTAGIKFVYEDPRDHWCQTCNVVLPSMNDMFRHLHSPKHKEATPSHERPWAEAEKQQQAGTQKFHRTIVSAVKGVQFLVGISGYYCKLCKVMSGDSAMARNHLHSIEHNQNYTKYILLNPFYERRWKMEKDIAIGAAIKEEKEKKKQEKEKQEKEKFEKERDKSRSRSRSPTAPSSFEHNFSSKRSKSSRKEEQEKIRRKSEELLKAERENSRSVKELDDSDVSPKKGGDKSASPPPSRANTGGSGIKLKLLKGQKTQKQPPKQTPVVIIGKAPCFRPSFLSGKPKVGAAATATTAKQEESKPYGPALPPNLASATAAELVEEAKKNEESMEIPLPNSASEKPGLLPTPVTSVAPTVPTPAPPTSAMLVSRKQALKSGVVTKTPLLPLPGSSMSEEDMDLKLLGIERDDIQPIAPVKPPPAFGPAPPPTSPVQLPNLSVPPPMFPVPPPKRTLLPSPRYLATVPPPTMAPLNVPPPT
ncbi:hypothetical protein V5799_021529, partial [Amblyomma americanum]